MASESSATMPAPGTITWVEIPAIDLTRVQTFYNTVFGWNTTTPEAMPDHGVLLFTHGSTHGSFVKVSPENFLSPALHPNNPDKARLAVRVTMLVESVDESLEKVEKAGGKLYIPKKEIPGNMGFLIYFTDTESNVMGLWSMK